ncbi:MAG: hypothetical protein AB7E49_01330 [Campylobacterales bacterium]
MYRQKVVALAAAVSFLLPGSLMAAHAVKVDSGKWTLIGATGVFTTTSTTGGTNDVPDMSGTQALIDIAESDNNITWDANASLTDFNTVAVSPATAQGITEVTYVNDGTTLGLPFHSIVGIRAMAGYGTLEKAAVAFARPDWGKDYGSPMRTMYVRSPYSTGLPDVMIVYQASGMEGRTFKITFKNDQAEDWDFIGDYADNDPVYQGTFDHTRTYDNPARLSDGLTRLTETATGGSSNSTYYPMITEAFDMNISDNIADMSELNITNFQAVDGNLTVYKYNAQGGLWQIGEVRNATGPTGVVGGVTNLGATASSAVNRTTLENLLATTSTLTNFEAGYGYWTKFDRDTGSAYTPAADAQAGFLLNAGMNSAASYADVLEPGWNLLAFNDSTLRYATSGFVIDDAIAGDINVSGPYYERTEATVIPATPTAADCLAFNTAVVASNANVNNHNSIDVRCYWAVDAAGGEFAVLVSDKQFFVGLATPADAALITNLSGSKTFSTSDLRDLDVSGTPEYLLSTYGDYAAAVEYNTDLAELGTIAGVDVGAIEISLPAFAHDTPYSVTFDGTDADANASTVSHSALFNTFVSTNGYGTAPRGRILSLDVDGDTGHESLLVASNNRFYLRDATYVRKFNVEDVNGSQLALGYDSTFVQTAVNGLNWSETNSTVEDRDCSVLSTAIATASTNNVLAYCLQDANTSMMFVSASKLNYDVREMNTSVSFLTDSHLTGSEANATVYGAARSVYQASVLATAGQTGGFNSPSATVGNLTYTAVWAEDFPNNGPLYYVTGNGYKPEMIITAVTNDNSNVISWKALDVTRDPAEWFDNANDFELFWTEKERGYWVYLETGYTNPVSVSGTAPSGYVVNKHFNNELDASGVGSVFNWFDGSLDATVDGLVRSGYTSGESYTVNANVAGASIPMMTDGAIFSGTQSTFTTYLSDFEVSAFRPTGLLEANVTASDGLGGRGTDGAIITYAKPTTPAVTFSGNSDVSIVSDTYADRVLIFDGNITDLNPSPIASVMLTDGSAAESLTSISGITYPAATTAPVGDNDVPVYADALGTILKDLRFIASTGAADTGATYASGRSVYSDMKQLIYAPLYSDTARLTIVNGNEGMATTTPWLYDGSNGNDGQLATRNYGVQLHVASGATNKISVFFEPVDETLGSTVPNHFNFDVCPQPTSAGACSNPATVTTGVIGYENGYEGKPFYVYVENTTGTGKLWYGVFPDKDNYAGTKLVLRTDDAITQTAPVDAAGAVVSPVPVVTP